MNMIITHRQLHRSLSQPPYANTLQWPVQVGRPHCVAQWAKGFKRWRETRRWRWHGLTTGSTCLLGDLRQSFLSRLLHFWFSQGRNKPIATGPPTSVTVALAPPNNPGNPHPGMYVPSMTSFSSFGNSQGYGRLNGTRPSTPPKPSHWARTSRIPTIVKAPSSIVKKVPSYHQGHPTSVSLKTSWFQWLSGLGLLLYLPWAINSSRFHVNKVSAPSDVIWTSGDLRQGLVAL